MGVSIRSVLFLYFGWEKKASTGLKIGLPHPLSFFFLSLWKDEKRKSMFYYNGGCLSHSRAKVTPRHRMSRLATTPAVLVELKLIFFHGDFWRFFNALSPFSSSHHILSSFLPHSIHSILILQTLIINSDVFIIY